MTRNGRVRGVRTAGVRAHQAGPELGGDLGKGRVMPAPGVVDEVSTRCARLLGHLRAPGVDTDQLVGVGVAQPLDERHDAGDLLVDTDRVRLDLL